MLFSAIETDAAGTRVRRYYPLSLERNRVSFFPLSWTIVHPITSDSPFHGRTEDDLTRSEVEILVLLSGIDDTFAQAVHTRSSYRAEEIRWGAKFRSIYPGSEDRTALRADIGRLHDIEDVAG